MRILLVFLLLVSCNAEGVNQSEWLPLAEACTCNKISFSERTDVIVDANGITRTVTINLGDSGTEKVVCQDEVDRVFVSKSNTISYFYRIECP